MMTLKMVLVVSLAVTCLGCSRSNVANDSKKFPELKDLSIQSVKDFKVTGQSNTGMYKSSFEFEFIKGNVDEITNDIETKLENAGWKTVAATGVEKGWWKDRGYSGAGHRCGCLAQKTSNWMSPGGALKYEFYYTVKGDCRSDDSCDFDGLLKSGKLSLVLLVDANDAEIKKP